MKGSSPSCQICHPKKLAIIGSTTSPVSSIDGQKLRGFWFHYSRSASFWTERCFDFDVVQERWYVIEHQCCDVVENNDHWSGIGGLMKLIQLRYLARLLVKGSLLPEPTRWHHLFFSLFLSWTGFEPGFFSCDEVITNDKNCLLYTATMTVQMVKLDSNISWILYFCIYPLYVALFAKEFNSSDNM